MIVNNVNKLRDGDYNRITRTIIQPIRMKQILCSQSESDSSKSNSIFFSIDGAWYYIKLLLLHKVSLRKNSQIMHFEMLVIVEIHYFHYNVDKIYRCGRY